MGLCYRPAMSFLRRDLLALLIAIGAAVAGVVVWMDGSVTLGLHVRETDETHGGLVVSDVTPGGNAARNFIVPGQTVIDLETVDGTTVARGRSVQWEGGVVTLPVEAVEQARIAYVNTGQIVEGPSGEEDAVEGFAMIHRDWLESRLATNIYLLGIGLALGLVVWRLLHHGLAGEIGRREAVVVAAATATPFLLATVVQVGSPIGIYAAYLAPLVIAVLLGVGLARQHDEPAWRQAGVAASLVAAVLAVILVVRQMTLPTGSPEDREPILVLIASVALAPAVIGSLGKPRGWRERASLMALALLPFAALTLILPSDIDPALPLVLIVGLLGWHALPLDTISDAITGGFRRVRSGPTGESSATAPEIARARDLVAFALIGLAVLVATSQGATWALVVGLPVAFVVGLAVRRGFLSPEWSDAAVPLAASVSIPVMLVTFAWYADPASLAVVIPTALAALVVAHVLAARHTDADWRSRLFLLASGLVVSVLVALAAVGSSSLAVALLGFVALVPGIPVAFADRPGEPQAISSRLETMAVALTPGAAATVLVTGDAGALILGGWLAALIIWRYFTLGPLVGMAKRTQLQRDLAVAAAETERARLAADLHDDALQQLTVLVRTLDEAGQTDAAAEAREVATKLRSVVGDLRLPILDDLGAGAALEWLVERIEPLAGGPVKLERTDTSRPPANVELAVFRVAQEALNNAVRHGRAPIAVRYDVNADGRVTLAVDDAGTGIDDQAAEEAPRQGHFGLANMQQRAEQIGALLDVRPWPAGGTRVAFEWRPQ